MYYESNGFPVHNQSGPYSSGRVRIGRDGLQPTKYDFIARARRRLFGTHEPDLPNEDRASSARGRSVNVWMAKHAWRRTSADREEMSCA